MSFLRGVRSLGAKNCYIEYNLKDKQSQKLLEEPIHAVVSLLLVLTDLYNVILHIFLQNINNIKAIFQNPKLEVNQ